MHTSNFIDASAEISKEVKFGKYNRIGKNVKIIYVGKEVENVIINIGDNNIFNDNVKILIDGDFIVGDWNVFHNDMLIMSGIRLEIGHNCWFGQNTILDGAGELEIGNGVRVGMYSQIWTHVASGEQIEGCTLYGYRKTTIEDDVWLVGSCIVGSGLKIGYRSIALINSVITKDTAKNSVSAGSPAKQLPNLNFYKNITLIEKLNLLNQWLDDWDEINNNKVALIRQENSIILIDKNTQEKVEYTISDNISYNNLDYTLFSLNEKKYNKLNSHLERSVYKYLYNNKARFIPI